jgi:flavodoxin
MTARPSIAIVYASVHHGNTQKVADVLSVELSADTFTVAQASGIELSQYDLVGVGSGIYFGRHHTSLLELVDRWRTPPRKTFIFSTAGLPILRWCQHAVLRQRLKAKKCLVLAEFCCRGWDTVGPLWLMGGINRKHPNAKDLQRARDFARQLKESVSVS